VFEVVEADQAVMKDKSRFIMNGVEYVVNENIFFDPEVIKDGGRAPRRSPVVKTLSYTTCRDTKVCLWIDLLQGLISCAGLNQGLASVRNRNHFVNQTDQQILQGTSLIGSRYS